MANLVLDSQLICFLSGKGDPGNAYGCPVIPTTTQHAGKGILTWIIPDGMKLVRGFYNPFDNIPALISFHSISIIPGPDENQLQITVRPQSDDFAAIYLQVFPIAE